MVMRPLLVRAVQTLLGIVGLSLLSAAYRSDLEAKANPKVTDLLKRYTIECKSVLHIGAHFGEEAAEYREFGMQRGIFVEGDPLIYPELKKTIGKFTNFSTLCALISNSKSQVNFFRASNDGASSSLLKPARHSKERPDILFDAPDVLMTVTLDSLNLGIFDLIVIDVQGAELKVISGGLKTIQSASAIWIEVNSGNMYDGDSDSFEVLSSLSENFVPVYMNMNDNFWGDALLVNRKFLSKKQLSPT
jgi:FkbM family methyltransferase